MQGAPPVIIKTHPLSLARDLWIGSSVHCRSRSHSSPILVYWLQFPMKGTIASHTILWRTLSSPFTGPMTPSVGFFSSNLGIPALDSASSILYRCNTSATNARTSLLAMNLPEQCVMPPANGLKSGLLPSSLSSRKNFPDENL